MTAPVSIPASVFTAGHGYAWSAQPAGIGRETMDELYRIATAGRDAFADDAAPTTGIASDGKTAAAFSLMRARAWDSEGRDADYAAFAFVPCADAARVDFAALMENDFFRVPVRVPPTGIDYSGPDSAAAAIDAPGRLLCRNELDGFDLHAAGDLLARHAHLADRWLFLVKANGAAKVTTSPWHKPGGNS